MSPVIHTVFVELRYAGSSLLTLLHQEGLTQCGLQKKHHAHLAGKEVEQSSEKTISESALQTHHGPCRYVAQDTLGSLEVVVVTSLPTGAAAEI